MILNGVGFKGNCPVELFGDMYKLSQSGLLSISDYEFKQDCALVTFFDGMMMENEIVEINEYRIWFEMELEKEKGQLFMMIGPGGGETTTTLKLTTEVLNFYNKWFEFKQKHPHYEAEKIIPGGGIIKPTARTLQDIECETCLFVSQCDRVFCLK